MTDEQKTFTNDQITYLAKGIGEFAAGDRDAATVLTLVSFIRAAVGNAPFRDVLDAEAIAALMQGFISVSRVDRSVWRRAWDWLDASEDGLVMLDEDEAKGGEEAKG